MQDIIMSPPVGHYTCPQTGTKQPIYASRLHWLEHAKEGSKLHYQVLIESFDDLVWINCRRDEYEITI